MNVSRSKPLGIVIQGVPRFFCQAWARLKVWPISWQAVQKAIRRTWPDALDLLLICVQSGMGLESALVRVSEEISSQCAALAEELVLTTAELSYLSDRHKAFDNFARRIGLDDIKAYVRNAARWLAPLKRG